jgi:hypothetical protein
MSIPTSEMHSFTSDRWRGRSQKGHTIKRGTRNYLPALVQQFKNSYNEGQYEI